MEFSRQEYWGGLPCPSPGALPNPSIEPGLLHCRQILYCWATGEAHWWHAATARSLQSCPTLCNPIDGSPPGSPIPGILQAKTLEWVAISFSNAWEWKVKVKSLSRVWLLATPWTAAHQAPPSMGFSRQEYWNGVPLPSLIGGMTCLQICIRGVPCRRETQARWRLTWGRESTVKQWTGLEYHSLPSGSPAQLLTDSRSQGSCAFSIRTG